jgi:hypothetical protein
MSENLTLESETTAERKEITPLVSSDLLAVAYGGGTNSTAMLCGFVDRGIKPDLILFADTGAERPETYEYVKTMQAKVKEWWGMEIEIVRALYKGQFEGLEGECLRGNKLPSIAYGGLNARACSVKYKTAPQSKRIKAELKKIGGKMVTRAIGFDAGEAHRVKKSTDEWATNWYPLVEWRWQREHCMKAICKYGLPQPGKSACYFCTASRPSEIFNMKKSHPELIAKALEIERRAQTRNRAKIGLGGAKNLWSDWLEADARQEKIFDLEPMHAPCGCIDG